MKQSSVKILFFTIFLDLVGFGIIIPLSPYLAKTYNASALEIGWLMSVYSLFQFIFSPIWGALSDRIGRRPIILLSLFGASLSYFGFAWGSSFAMLCFWRGLAGAFAANISTAQAYLADVTDDSERTSAMGLIGAAFGLGFIFGPFIGAVTGQWGLSLGDYPPWGLHFPALIAGGLTLINFIFAYFCLKEPEVRKKSGHKKVQSLVGAWKHLAQPFKNILSSMMMFFFLVSFSMALMEVMVFPYVQENFGWSMYQAGYGFALIGLVMAWVQGVWVRKKVKLVGERRLLLPGLVIMAIGLSGIGWSYSIWLLALSMLFLAVGNGMVRPPLMGMISLAADDDSQGLVMGIAQSLSSVGRIFGPLLGGYLYDNWNPGGPFWVSGLLVFLVFGWAMKLYAKLPDQKLMMN